MSAEKLSRIRLESMPEWEAVVTHCMNTQNGLMEQLLKASSMEEVCRLQGQIDILRGVPLLPAVLFKDDFKE